MTHGDARKVIERLGTVFSAMHVEVPSSETDLFESGILDSQRLVELLFQIEQSFGTRIDVEDFEIENFRCLEKIANLIVQRGSEAAQLAKVGESAA